MAKSDFQQSLVIAEDDDFVIINKPSGMASSHDRGAGMSLSEFFEKEHPDWRIIHRLDKYTTGVMVLAKNDEFYRHFSILLEKRRVKKTYHALVGGVAGFKEEKVKKPILYKASHVQIDQAGKEALTIVNTLKVYKFHTLLECRPVTGRMHQIRIHLASLGYPITGDKLYEGKDIYLSQIKRNFNLKKNTDEKPLIARMALHAYSVSFEDMDEKERTFKAPYPKDFRALINQLTKNI